MSGTSSSPDVASIETLAELWQYMTSFDTLDEVPRPDPARVVQRLPYAFRAGDRPLPDAGFSFVQAVCSEADSLAYVAKSPKGQPIIRVRDPDTVPDAFIVAQMSGSLQAEYLHGAEWDTDEWALRIVENIDFGCTPSALGADDETDHDAWNLNSDCDEADRIFLNPTRAQRERIQ